MLKILITEKQGICPLAAAEFATCGSRSQAGNST